MTYKNYSLINWCTKHTDKTHRFQKADFIFFDPQNLKNILSIFALVPCSIKGAEILPEHVSLGGPLEKKISPLVPLTGEI